MQVYQINPLTDPRWAEFIAQHPRSSVFHTPGWLDALQRTYSHVPVALTTSPPGEIPKNGLVFCSVQSWLTGKRCVSLPFSDHCDPLVESRDEYLILLSELERHALRTGANYIEVRPLTLPKGNLGKLSDTGRFCFHQLDLRPPLAEIYGGFHKDCVQRKIRRAEREHLEYEEGCASDQLAEFYRLMILTRRRHMLAPQPFAWFQNLAKCLRDRLKIRLAVKQGRAIAAILTLHWQSTMVYKYGCSDASTHNLGGMQFLLWRAIQDARESGCRVFDLGRSDIDSGSLISFKDRWGAARSEIEYFRTVISESPNKDLSWLRDWQNRAFRALLPVMPDRLLCAAGAVIYRHLG